MVVRTPASCCAIFEDPLLHYPIARDSKDRAFLRIALRGKNVTVPSYAKR